MRIRPRFIFIFPVIMPILAFWQVALCYRCMKWDAIEQYFPNRYLISQFLAENILPLWNPRIQLGFPMASDPQSGVFYPPVWILARLFGYDVCLFQWEWTAHLVLAGFGMYFLLRTIGLGRRTAMLFAVIFQLSGPFLSNGQHMTWIISMAWLPWSVAFLLALLKRVRHFYIVGLAFALTMGLTGGYPAFTFVLAYVFLVILAGFAISAWLGGAMRSFYPKILGVAAGGLGAGLLSSGYLYAVIQAMPYVNRGGGVSSSRALEGSISIESLLTFFAPFANSDTSHLFPWTSMMNMYMGFLTIPLILYGCFSFSIRSKDRRFFYWLAGGVLMLMLAMGETLPFRQWAYHLPLMDFFRFPALFRIFAILFLIPAAAMAWESISDHHVKSFARSALIPYILFVIALMVLCFSLSQSGISLTGNVDAGQDKAFPGDFYERGGLHLILIALFLLSAHILAFISRQGFRTWIPLIMMLDMVLAAQLNAPYNLFAKTPPSQLQAAIDERPDTFQIPDIDLPMLEQNMFAGSKFAPMTYNSSYFTGELAYDGYYPFSLSNLQAFDQHPDKWKRMENGIYFFIPDLNDSLDATITIQEWNPVLSLLKVDAKQPGTLVYFQNDYPKWKVVVNGEEAQKKVFFNNLPAVHLEGGTHDVQFIYSDNTLRALWKLTAVLMILTVLFLLVKALFIP